MLGTALSPKPIDHPSDWVKLVNRLMSPLEEEVLRQAVRLGTGVQNRRLAGPDRESVRTCLDNQAAMASPPDLDQQPLTSFPPLSSFPP